MSSIGKIKVGTTLVERGKVYKVFKLGDEKFNGEIHKVMYYKPYFDDPAHNGLICSLPIESIDEANIREPSTKNEIREILTDLSRQVRLRTVLGAKEAKSAVNENDIGATVNVIKKFSAEMKKRESGNLPKSKRDILDSAIDQIVQEIAFVSNTSLKLAHDKVDTALKN